MTKKELRKKYKELRNDLSFDVIEDLSLQIANQALKLPIWNFENYHVFLTIHEHKEVQTDYLLHILNGKDKNVIVSKSDFETRTMNHVLLTDNVTIKKNEWNIPEPQNGFSVADNQIDVVFVPLLAYDVFGNRVGYGKGFYDLFLSKCKPNVVKIGFSFFNPEPVISNVFSEDIRLDYCITPTNTIKF
ncbi:5-formyltetrahydrofolate cyclo-ligase [Paenimyroides viscosum]|jgi:5-formyltetrahydrofolate cyclo-ligase|uniref:5-formyltetrahydrofolate cyclo-ligase n=1 Tax=Paenimyroides viscosum TaxID=2488729 RepID=A0A3P1B117_9FLAO|nr:5-formyltetrahydrofolate cyclo-ligase [Paenimyroides viscosum]RRA94671.1 5-formyltetrahydrofolate cyclo-ligase [Paenimyroides viscosum]